ncbi:MAG: rod shape-determining protein MreC, partial [Pseudomonadota bacterium]
RLETYVNVLGELDQLEHQKQQVERWQARALELEREIDKYRQLVNARDLRTFSFVTGRVVADGRGVFARSVILNVGTRAGVASGRPVVDAGGLVGRTLNAGERATRVLLLTDPNSRIPVRFGAEGLEGVLVGDTTPTPEIAFAPQSTTAKVNDEVRTSGRGGLFPPGLAIGRITTISPRVRVSLYTDPDQIDFVSVLLFERPEVDAFDGAADPALVAARATAAGGEPKRGDMALPVRPPRAVARDAGRQQAVRRERRTQRGRGQ